MGAIMKTSALYAITNSDQSVSLLDASFQRVASWAKDYASKPRKHHTQVMFNCWKYLITWVN